MAKIMYGVCGEGSGHSSRARELATHLQNRGHELWLVSYDRGYRNLKDDFRMIEVEGFCIASEDNKVSYIKTFMENVKRFPAEREAYQRLRQVFEDVQPDCVITDFEPLTAYLANDYDLPLITVDNQHRIRYGLYECPPGLDFDYQLVRTICRAVVPRPDVSLVTTLMPAAVRNDRTFLFPPIVRREVRALQPTDGEHVLVYLTSGGESLLDELHEFPRETFRVYGYDRDDQDGELHYKSFDRHGFLHDLADAKAVIATAGFSLMSESLYLRKPYLAVPMEGQFEQQLNAFHLEKLGYGRNAQTLSPAIIGEFMYRIPEYRERLAEYEPSDNREIKAKLDELLDDGCRVAHEFHKRRKLEA